MGPLQLIVISLLIFDILLVLIYFVLFFKIKKGREGSRKMIERKDLTDTIETNKTDYICGACKSPLYNFYGKLFCHRHGYIEYQDDIPSKMIPLK